MILHLVVPDRAPLDAARLPVSELDRLVAPPGVVASLTEELDVLAGRTPWPERRPDWYRPAWWEELDTWVDEALDQRGVRRTGPTLPLRVWSLSAVLRVPTDDGDVVVKAACEHFRVEPAVTRWLDALTPGRVPSVLATDLARGWMLMRAFSGVEGDDQPQAAPEAARCLAAVQLAAAEQLADLRTTGIPDRSLGRTLTSFAAVVRDGLGLDQLDDDERRRIATLPDWLAGKFGALAAVGLPTTLLHGDLHAGNYVVGDAGVVLFDWTDAALGDPALDAFLLGSSAGRSDPALEQVTLEAWADVWQSAHPELDVLAAIGLAEPVFLAYQAVSYDGLVRAQEDRSQWEMGSAAPRCLRRLLALRDGEGRG